MKPLFLRRGSPGTRDALPRTMEAKPIQYSNAARESYRPSVAAAVLAAAQASAPPASVSASRAVPAAPAQTDPILAIFAWLCSGPVSKWERELTRKARWRIG